MSTTLETTAPSRDVYVKLKLRDARRIRQPSLRNRDIFAAVKIDHRTLRDVGAEFKLSHPRVQVIVRQVERWIGTTIGRGETGDWLQRKGVAEYLHRERLHHLYGQALDGWHDSRKDQQRRKIVQIDGQPQRRELIEFTSPGNPRFLKMALEAEDMRMAFDYESGSIQPPEDDEMYDAETKSEATKVLSQAYYDRPPGAEVPADARLQAEREARALAEEERATAEAALKQLQEEVAAREAERAAAEEAASAVPGSSAEVVEQVASCGEAKRVRGGRTSSLRELTESAKQELAERQQRSRAAGYGADREEEFFYRVQPQPVDVGNGQMVVPPRVITNWVDRKRFVEEYWREVRGRAKGVGAEEEGRQILGGAIGRQILDGGRR